MTIGLKGATCSFRMDMLPSLPLVKSIKNMNDNSKAPFRMAGGFIGIIQHPLMLGNPAIRCLQSSKRKDTKMSVLKKLNATSEMLVRATGQIDKKIAAHLVAIADHINGAGNGDVSAANHFFSLLTSTSGLRKDAIGNWLMAYAGCSWNAEKKQFGRKKDFAYDKQAAVENPWYVFTKQKEFQPFDLDKALKQLVTKAKAKLAEEALEHKGHAINKAHLRALECIINGEFQFEEPSMEDETLDNDGEEKDIDMPIAPEEQAA